MGGNIVARKLARDPEHLAGSARRVLLKTVELLLQLKSQQKRPATWNEVVAAMLRRMTKHVWLLTGWLAEKPPCELELLAWSARNLFELDLTLRCLTQESAAIGEFKDALLWDFADLTEGLERVWADDPRRLLELREGLSRVANIAKEHGMKKGQRWPIGAELARRTGALREYNAFYKIYSKYEHPSPLATLLTSSEGPLRFVFATKACRYAISCLRILRKAAGVTAADA